jgi:hypothetical protein
MEQENNSKKLGHWDENSFLFKKEMLSGDVGYSIDFDGVQKHKERGYIIWEFLLCEKNQFVDPYTSHPNRYWHKNKNKFIRLFELSKKLEATLYLVNYAKSGTIHEDKILAIKVLSIDPVKGVSEQQIKKFTRASFKQWYRGLNEESNTLLSNDNI